MVPGTERLALNAAVAFLTSFVATPVVRRLVIRWGLIDRPNERSSHTEPTPRGGGLAILIGAAAAIASSPFVGGVAGFAIAAAVLSIVGFVDDWKGLSAPFRFAMQCFAAVLVTLTWCGFSIDGARPGMTTLVLAGAIFWIAGNTNAYNFMDGINGIAAVQGIAAATALSILAARHGDAIACGIAIAFGAACAGFLPWNFPKARIFMGDVASGTLGFTFAALALRYFLDGGSLVAAVLPLTSFLADTGATLVRRAARGDNLAKPHRTHFYQRLTNLGWSHTRVTALYGAFAAVCGALAILYESMTAARGWIIAVVAAMHLALMGFVTLNERRSATRASDRGLA
jgi:UDP-GlcNAc:undecaprenyl-phosphate GlcNAc-1-phosphate transferase